MNFEVVANPARFTTREGGGGGGGGGGAASLTVKFTSSRIYRRPEICHSETANQNLTGHQNVE